MVPHNGTIFTITSRSGQQQLIGWLFVFWGEDLILKKMKKLNLCNV
jgi:hypothetical protein